MQVSWIDPDEVRDLLKQLEGPKPASTQSAWEVHTLPAAQVTPVEVEPLIGEACSQPAPMTPAPTLEQERPGLANAELCRIRERLRALRDKAHSAGIFTRSRLDETPPPASLPIAEEIEPAPVPAVEPVIEEPPPPEPEPEAQAIEAVSVSTLPDAIQPASETLPIESPFDVVETPPPVFEPLFETAAEPAVSTAVVPEPEAVPEPPLPEETPAETATPSVESAPFTVPDQGLSERLNAVAEWVCARLGTREVLLFDDYGDVLWGAEGQTALVLSAVMAWHSAQRASASATCIDPERIDKPLPPDRALTVLPLRTRYGVVSLAAIQAQPISNQDAVVIRQALTLAVEGHVGSNSNEGT